MNAAPDPLARQKAYWSGYGDFIVRGLGAGRAEVDANHRDPEVMALALRQSNPKLANIMDQMATEFYTAAIAALESKMDGDA